MNRFKSIKNYLTSTAASTLTTENEVINATNKISINFRKTSVDSIVLSGSTVAAQIEEAESYVKIFNVNTFNKSNQDDSSTTTIRPKFLRSKSIEERGLKLKKTNSTSCKKDSDLSGNDLFQLLEQNLDKLIEHFKPVDFDAQMPPLAQAQDTTSLLPSPYYMDTSDTSTNTYFKLVMHAKLSLVKCVSIYNKIENKCSVFDYESGRIKANGYRSILSTFEVCCKRFLNVINDLNDKKSSFFFQLKLNTTLPVNSSLKELQAWVRLVEKYEIILQTAIEMQNIALTKIDKDSTLSPSLFINSKELYDSTIETNLFYLGSIYQEAFFGRSCGFQFCDSLQMPLTGCAVALASYNDGYEAYSNKENWFSTTTTITTKIGSPTFANATNTSPISTSPTTTTNYFTGQATLFKSLFSGTKYILDPELRAKKISRVIKDANVEFCKAFWQLTETSIVQMGSNLITPQLAVNVVKKISLAMPLKLPRVIDGKINDPEDYVTINPPEGTTLNDTVQIRLLSSEMRIGMQEIDNLKGVESPSVLLNNFINFPTAMNNFTATTPNSPYLILHVHGGGFIAHSSKSHEIYLKPWCKELKIPIVSIDYSLAPEHAFPRGSQECFYVYAWCLLNKTSLGWTGEKIICVGDSAGGVLVTNIVQRAIKSQIRIPDALIPIYAPFLLTYSLSPSRLMSVMDPLLNLGILWRCLAAYCGIDFKTETERYKTFLNLHDAPDITKPKQPPAKQTLSKSLSLRAFLSRSLTPSPNPASPTRPSETQHSEFRTRFSQRESSSPDYDSSEDENKISKSVSSYDFKDNEKQQLEEEKAQTVEFYMEETHKKRILHLYKVLGDSVFLVEKLRDFPLTINEFMSPMLSDDSVLSKFPQTFLITASLDPLLDDNIEFNRKLESLNVVCKLDILKGLHHGFLNFITASKDCYRASKYVTSIIKIAIGSPTNPARLISKK